MNSVLKNSVLFAGIDDDDLILIEEIGQVSKIEKSRLVFLQDDPAERFFIVLKGKVKISKLSPEGKEQVLLLPGPGDSFGEAALFSSKSYPASAEAIENSELMSFTREAFQNLIRENPTLAVNMIARLSMLLHHMTQMIQRLSLEDVTTRLASYLIHQLPSKESKADNKIMLTEKKMILAALLGTIPETLSRSLARLTQSGIITVEGSEITVLDLQKLSAVAAGEKL